MDLRRPIVTLDLEYLLDHLNTHSVELLKLIDEDPHLRRREHAQTGLIIANSAPTLFEPEFEHQLYAKGIVYRREPEYELVSLPLVKMFNHTLRAHSDATSQTLVQDEGVRCVFPEKLDGTMVQLFADQGRTYLSTRSVLEGSERAEETAYVSLARELLEELYPELAEGREVAGLSLTFEMIHPKTRQVTSYGAERRMVLIAVFDHARHVYWSNAHMRAWGEARGVEVARPVLEEEDFVRGVARLHELLQSDPSIPEGSIVCFERGDAVIHRVKVKTEEYLHHFAMRYKISMKTVTTMLWNRPELHDWEGFRAHLIQEQLSEEEVEAFYREHFEAFMVWRDEVVEAHAAIHALHEAWLAEHGDPPQDEAATNAWFKMYALWLKANHAQQLGQVMMLARRGVFTLESMMWQMPAYAGFRHELALAGIKG